MEEINKWVEEMRSNPEGLRKIIEELQKDLEGIGDPRKRPEQHRLNRGRRKHAKIADFFNHLVCLTRFKNIVYSFVITLPPLT